MSSFDFLENLIGYSLVFFQFTQNTYNHYKFQMESESKETIAKIIKRTRFLKTKGGEDVMAFQVIDGQDFPVFLTKDHIFIEEKEKKVKKKNVRSGKEIQEMIEKSILSTKSNEDNYIRMFNEVKKVYGDLRTKINSLLDEGEVQLLKKLPNEKAVPEFLKNFQEEKLVDDDKFRDAFEDLLRYFGSDIHNFDTEEFLDNIQTNRDKMIKVMEKEMISMNKLFIRPKDSQILEGSDFENLVDWISEYHPKPKWDLLYRGSADGATAADFHRLCDNKGPNLVLIKNQLGRRFGGYNNTSWKSDGSREENKKTFVFSLDLKEKYTHGGRGSGAKATSYNNASNGFYFGSDNGYRFFMFDSYDCICSCLEQL